MSKSYLNFDKDWFTQYTRATLPIILAHVILVLISIMSFVSFLNISAHIGIIFVYYWAIHQPKVITIYSAALLGLTLDIILNTHLGFYALTYTAVFFTLKTQHKHLSAQPYWAKWLGCTATLIAIHIVQLLYAVAILQTPYNFSHALFEILQLSFLFPFASILLFYLSKLPDR